MKADLVMRDIRKLARKWGISAPVRLSDRAQMKLMVQVGGEWIHFGASAYDDFTTHKDERRRANYCARASGIRDAKGRVAGNNPSSPNFYSMRLLWDCAPPPDPQ